ncbi:MAG: integration host factor subunit alpha [Methylocystis sp.]|uniref:integration host factor subunit alpha n=1 Tax=Methylocystis sp. TaxID=1911079 RepID=UPI003DA65C02
MASAETENQTEGTLTRDALRDAAYRSCPTLSRAEVRAVVDAALEEISEALLRGEFVKLREFGTFKVRSKSERVGRNPATGVEAVITPRRVITFKPSPLLKAMVNGRADGVENGGEE